LSLEDLIRISYIHVYMIIYFIQRHRFFADLIPGGSFKLIDDFLNNIKI